MEYFLTIHSLSDTGMPLFGLTPEFPAAGTRMTDSFWFKHFIMLNFFSFLLKLKVS